MKPLFTYKVTEEYTKNHPDFKTKPNKHITLYEETTEEGTKKLQLVEEDVGKIPTMWKSPESCENMWSAIEWIKVNNKYVLTTGELVTVTKQKTPKSKCTCPKRVVIYQGCQCGGI